MCRLFKDHPITDSPIRHPDRLRSMLNVIDIVVSIVWMRAA
jgi:hypothetical protein